MLCVKHQCDCDVIINMYLGLKDTYFCMNSSIKP